jgi:hypothetical protein
MKRGWGILSIREGQLKMVVSHQSSEIARRDVINPDGRIAVGRLR